MRSFLVFLAITVNAEFAELSHKDKMNLAVVDTDGKLVYPAREMAKVSAEIDEIQKLSHGLDMKLSQMEDLNLKDPEVWKKYSHTRDAARTASSTLETLRERMQGLDDQYLQAEKKIEGKKVQRGDSPGPGVLLQLPGDSAIVPSEEKVKGEKTWSAHEDLKHEEAQEVEKKTEAAHKASLVEVDAKSSSKWQHAMSLLETGFEKTFVATETDYQMALYLADQGLSMDQIREEFHIGDNIEKEIEAEKTKLPQSFLEKEAKAQEEKRQDEKAKNKLKIKSLKHKSKDGKPRSRMDILLEDLD